MESECLGHRTRRFQRNVARVHAEGEQRRGMMIDATGPSGKDVQGVIKLRDDPMLRALRHEIEHFLAHADVEGELLEERRLFALIQEQGEQINRNFALDEVIAFPANTRLRRTKMFARKLLWPLFRMIIGPQLARQSRFNALAVQYLNVQSQLVNEVASKQRLYKAHLSNLSQNLALLLQRLHEADGALNEKLDLLVDDLDRKLLSLRSRLESDDPPEHGCNF